MMTHSYYTHTLNYLCIALLLIIRIAFNLAFVVPPNATVEGNELNSEPETCSSPECILVRSEIVKYINKSVHPCDDFYEFSCGQFMKNVLIPKGKGRVNITDFILEEFTKQFEALITESPPESAPKYFHFANNFYKSCMNDSYIEELKDRPMADISESVGGWPVLMKDKWNPNGTWTWEEATKKLLKLGFGRSGIILGLSNGLKEMRIIRTIPNLPGSILLDRRSALQNIDSLGAYVNDSKLHKERSKFFSYYNYMVDMAVLFGAEREFAKKEFKKCLKFEIDLQRIIDTEWDFRTTTFKKLPGNYSNEWLNYFKSLLPEDQLINENERVSLPYPKFFEKLSKLLKNTSNETIANFVMWRAHEYSTRYLSKEFSSRRASYYSLKNPQHMNERSKSCIQQTKSRLKTSINSQWAHKYLSLDKQAEAFKLIENITTSFKEFIEEADWMDKATKAITQNTLQSLSIIIDFPNELLDNTIMEEHFHSLDIDSNNYFESNLRLNAFDLKNNIEKVRNPVTYKSFVSYLSKNQFNAEYDENIVILYPLMLNDRMFNVDGPQYKNFGGLGITIAHAIAHQISFTRRHWTKSSKEAYKLKLNCIANQYGEFIAKLTKEKFIGSQTAYENLADNIGLKVAVMAYKKWNDKFGPEKSLPGLKYTSKQTFWIIDGQRWCSNYTPDYEKFQIIAPRQNCKEFAEDFNCAVGTAMNPEKKCLF